MKYSEGFNFENIGQTPYKKFISDTYINISPRGDNSDTLDNLFKDRQTQSEIKTIVNKKIEKTAKGYAPFYMLSEKRIKLILFE